MLYHFLRKFEVEIRISSIIFIPILLDSHFNLRSATTTGGAVSLEKMQSFLKTCVWNPVPAEFAPGKGK